jgi:hypothetical protein
MACQAWGTTPGPQLQFVPTQLNILAGTVGKYGDTGDGGPAISALLNGGLGIAIDSKGNIYFSDYQSEVIRKISTDGIISTIAGTTGTIGYAGDNGPATSAEFNRLDQIAFDSKGNLYIADRGNNVIRKIDGSGIITTFAGNYGNGYGSYGGDNGPATSAQLSSPEGVAVDAGDNVYIADTSNGIVRKVDTSGTITLFAGTPGVYGYTGDGGPAIQARLSPVQQVATDLAGNVYIADSDNGVVRKVDTSGIISTYAGGGQTIVTSSNEPIPATTAFIDAAVGLATDAAGNVYVYGGGNQVDALYWVDTSGNISIYEGQGTGTATGGPATSLRLAAFATVVDANGNLFVNDPSYHVIYEIGPNGIVEFGNQGVGTTSAVKSVLLRNTGGSLLTFNSTPYVVEGDFAVASGGTCDFIAGIAANTTCTMDVTFSPASTGNLSGTITFTTNAADSPNVVKLTGTGTSSTAPVATLSPNPLAFPSTTVGSTATALPVTLSNTGNAALTGIAISITGTNPGDFATTQATTCGTTLAAGASCMIYISFTPASATSFSATLSVADNATGAPQSAALTGTGTAVPVPQAVLSPNPVAFTNQVLNTTSLPMAVTLSNSGNATLNMTAAITGAGFAITTGPTACGSTLAAGAKCFIYVTFTPTSATGFSATLQVTDTANTPNDSPSVTLTGTGVSFVSNVGTATAAQAVTVYITTAGTPSSIQVLTQGAANLDFAKASGGSCTTTTAYTVGATCTVNVVFTPAFAGTRNGAILLTDPSGNALGTTYLPGIGNGPQIVFGPGGETRVPGSQVTPWGVAVDGAGNVYLNNTNSGSVLQIPWTGSAYGTPVAIATDVANALGKSIAVDGAGNVFVGSNAPDAIVTEIPRTPTGWGTQLIVPITGVGAGAFGITVDALGSLYVADNNGRVVKLPWTGNGYGTQTTLPFTGLISPYGVAVDGGGNVYVADHVANIVVELPWTGSGYGTQTTVPSAGLTNLTGLAVDGTSNLYVAGGIGSTSEIVRIPWSGSAYGTPTVLSGSDYTQVAVDGAGNVYGVEGLYANSELGISKIDLADPPSLSFASTNVGSTSTDSPQTVPITNIGNGDLTFTSANNDPSYPVNFPENTNDTNRCVAHTITEGASCDVSVNFTPTTGGSLFGDVVLTDNDLNGANARQSIPVNGTGVQAGAPGAKLTPTSLSFGNQTEGTASAPQVATLKNTGDAPLTGIVITLAENSGGDIIHRIRAQAIAASTDYAATTTCGTTLAAGASCTISVTFDPASIGSLPGTLRVADNAANSPQTVSLSGAGTAPLVPVATLTPASLTFTVATGSTAAAQTATLTNTGNAPLTGIAISITGTNSGDFSQTNTCASSLAAGASCTVSVTFTPASATGFTATLSVADNASGSPQTVSLAGTGTAPADFTVTAAPPSQSIASGASAMYTVTVASSGGSFNNSVALSVTGLPTGATGSFSPAQVNPGDGPATSTLTVQTASSQLARSRTGIWPIATPALALLLLLPFRRWRRFWRGKFLVLLLGLASLAAATTLMGCGGGFGFSQPSQTYTLTVTGTSGSDTHSTTVQLTVQ